MDRDEQRLASLLFAALVAEEDPGGPNRAGLGGFGEFEGRTILDGAYDLARVARAFLAIVTVEGFTPRSMKELSSGNRSEDDLDWGKWASRLFGYKIGSKDSQDEIIAALTKIHDILSTSRDVQISVGEKPERS